RLVWAGLPERGESATGNVRPRGAVAVEEVEPGESAWPGAAGHAAGQSVLHRDEGPGAQGVSPGGRRGASADGHGAVAAVAAEPVLRGFTRRQHQVRSGSAGD